MKLSDEMKLQQLFSTNPKDLGTYYPSVDGFLVMEWRDKVAQLEGNFQKAYRGYQQLLDLNVAFCNEIEKLCVTRDAMGESNEHDEN